MLLGYNTNGFAFHRLDDAIKIIGDLGYRCVAITVDNNALNPYADDFAGQAMKTAEQLGRAGLASVIETGARFLLDPRRKHSPTLLDRRAAGRERRMDFLRRCVDLAELLGSAAVSFWSGTAADDQDAGAAFGRLEDSCRELADYAAGRDVTLAFEPEPGMLVDTLAGYQRLADTVDRDNFRLTIDVGHLQCNEPDPPADLIRRFAPQLANVHLDDMRRGIHDHLMFGEGELNFVGVLGVLSDVGYEGPACVELSRHSHDAVETARRARLFLDGVISQLNGGTEETDTCHDTSS